MKNNNSYQQITQEERAIIAHHWRNKKSINYIARDLKRPWKTIKDELERNGEYDQFGKIIYSARKAQKKYLERRKKSKEKYRIIESNYELEDKLINLISGDENENLSPEQISGKFETVSFKTIYNWIWRMKKGKIKNKIIKGLRRQGKKYRKNNKNRGYESIIAPKTMIDQRPEIINNRERFGDFEGDLVKLNSKEVLYTLVDRKSKFTFITYLSNGYADLVNEATIKIWKKLKKKDLIKSITFDNGSEFSKHDLITSDTGLPIYFCFPYHSWEKGTNENTNGLIRQYYPKNIIHDNIKESDIKKIQDKLNHRPRKSLNYLTPYEVFVEGKLPEGNSKVQLTI